MRQLKSVTAPIFVAVCTCLTLWAAANPTDQKDKSAQAQNGTDLRKKYVRPTDPALYVGEETCKTCHEDMYKQFETTPHVATTMEAKLNGYKGPEWHGCEACHGPGKEHVDGGGDKTKIFTFKDASPAETHSAQVWQSRSRETPRQRRAKLASTC